MISMARRFIFFFLCLQQGARGFVQLTLPLAKPLQSSRINMSFVQQPGESDIDFIKRITSTPIDAEEKSSNKAMAVPKSSGGSNYRRIEEWEEEQQSKSKNGELTWEERAKFDGQRYGNQVKQNEILIRHLNVFH